jgi:TIR domain/NB-ARC domain
MADIFVSYTSTDEAWASWIGDVLASLGHEPHLHDWEISGGEDIAAWMEKTHDRADHILCVVSAAYLAAPYSSWERRAAQWAAARERSGFVLPVLVEACELPSLLSHIKRCNLYGIGEAEARERFKQFLGPAGKPEQPPVFPGGTYLPAEPSAFPGRSKQRLEATSTLKVSNRKLLEHSSDSTQSDSSNGALPVWQVPYPRNPQFTGRSEIITRLQQELQSGQVAAVTQAIAGLGGIGKTQLALEYCYRQASRYQAVWWIRAESEETRMADLASLAEALGLSVAGESDLQRSVSSVIAWLNRTPGWLLIFDNVETPEDLEDILPAAGRGHILITSRYPAWGTKAKTVHLNVWTVEESTQYLLRRTNEKNSKENKAAAMDLAQALGYLPLAVEQAAAYIDESKIGILGYSKLFKENQLRLFERREGHPPNDRHTIATVWDISIKSVESASPGAVALLQLCAFMRPDRISKQEIEAHCNILPDPLKNAVSNKIMLHDAIATLRRYSLIDATPEFISIHRLVQLVVRDRLKRLKRNDYVLFHEIADRVEHGSSDPSFNPEYEQEPELLREIADNERSLEVPVGKPRPVPFALMLSAAVVVVGVTANSLFGDNRAILEVTERGLAFVMDHLARPQFVLPQLVVGYADPRGQGEAAPLGVALSSSIAFAMVMIDGLQTGSNLNVGSSAGSSRWQLMATDLPNALIRPPLGFVGVMNLTAELHLRDGSFVDRKVVHLEWTAPVAATTERSFFRNFGPDEIDALVKGSEDLIAGGDLATARVVLQGAAEGGDAGAALTLAGTYDPLVLEKLGIQGPSADIARARAWYERAKELGSTEAPRRLEMLKSREH